MADFSISYNLTSKSEGGYTNHPDDNGNWTGGQKGVGTLVGTNLGISAPVLKDFLKRGIVVSDMKNLTKDVAMLIYKKNYWDRMRGDEILVQRVANIIYDDCVNTGPSSAIKKAQKILGVDLTGTMTTDTLDKLNNT